ncbi:ATP-binding protein [Spirosoma validum]|uniref:ATP-binding protein n=1 Tax=Spirosoma validum TaxID=2771355 RepID=A0A927AYQ3_9BACT|nr:ATP-binding protein [Spirosoma validum]MBD2752205.1 ATP-binding protein [Spirosoma validum]
MINRILREELIKRATSSKTVKSIIIIGPRQVGKTTLIKELETELETPITWWNGADADIGELLQMPTPARLRQLIGQTSTLIIDEAQRIETIGQCLKVITDNLKQVKVIAIGSSAFNLGAKTNEPSGRKGEFLLFPFSFGEMVNHHGLLEESRQLNQRLLFGYYPDVINNPGDEQAKLRQLTDNILYRDVVRSERILKPEKLEKLVQELAWQVGKDVSYYELGQTCGLDNQTVEKYILALEKAFVIHRLPCLNRALSNELKKSRKIYFYDNGIRNAVVNQFNPIEQRNDADLLWENFLINERRKYITYQNLQGDRYFWRTHAQQEIDYIEERNGALSAFNFKWNPKAKARFSQSFIKAYHLIETQVVSRDNFFGFIGIE